MTADDPELAAALQAIAEGPGDESLRRVLGDLLLERGDPRGDFLLLQFLIAEHQASGAMRQRAHELWRAHRREWMAGADGLLTSVQLDRGFPVAGALRPTVTREKLTAALGAPMLATLRRLEGCREGGVVLEALASPRLRVLREVVLRRVEDLPEAAARAVPGRLTSLELEFPVGAPEVERLLTAPAFAQLQQLALRTRPVHSRYVRARTGDELRGVADLVVRLGTHPTLRALTLTGDAFGDERRFLELVPLWPRLRLARLTVPGTFELTRDGEGTSLTLQNLPVARLLALRPRVPADTVRVLLMPSRGPQADGEDREALLRAYVAFAPKTLP